MAELYPDIEPYDQGLLDAGDGNQVYWEACGNPAGKPAVVLHGGPGSGCTPYFRKLFNPRVYRIVLLDQRNCGRSRPHASDPATSLESNTTDHVIRDIELLRQHLGIERWLVLGGSWGCALGLAYAEAHPERVTGMVLFGVTSGGRSELNWLFRGGVARFFPQQWDRLVGAVPEAYRGGDIVEMYARWLSDPDLGARQRATEEWCTWESATPFWPPRTGLAERFKDYSFAFAFARLVTHYVSHNLFLEDGALLRNAGALANIPGILVNGRFDFQSPIGYTWELRRAWPAATMVIVDNAGHWAEDTTGREL
ncbi:MAG: prolyl aminopeptidase, partial [Candidatus Dormibacterales bacterium]